jgi:hypothetical protein
VRIAALILGLAVAGVLVPDPAGAKRCRCPQGIVHTSRSCYEACGRGTLSGSVRREANQSSREHDRRSEAQARRAKQARRNAGVEPAPRPSRSRPVPKQQGLTNLEERPISAHLEGVFCSEGKVLFPKTPTREMHAFCRAPR